jgi:hypothetical protein
LHKGKWNPNYYGSGKLIRRALNKYGKENFLVQLICKCHSKEELEAQEIYYIAKYREKLGFYRLYNLSSGGKSSCGIKLSQERIDQIRLINTGKKRTPEQKARWRLSYLRFLNSMLPSDRVEFLGKRRRGKSEWKTFSEEKKESIIQRLKKANENYPQSARDKISAKMKGRKCLWGDKVKETLQIIFVVYCPPLGIVKYCKGIEGVIQYTGASKSGIYKSIRRKRSMENGCIIIQEKDLLFESNTN